jgi:hypothetical protein
MGNPLATGFGLVDRRFQDLLKGVNISMSTLTELEKAIRELEVQKQGLLDKVQNAGWKDNRPNERIPEKRDSDLTVRKLLEQDMVPEKSPLPSDSGLIYQQWYSAARTIIAKNQPSRLAEFDEVYSPTKKGAEPGIKQLLGKYVAKDEQFRLMDLINAQFEILAAVPSHLRFSIYDIELTIYSVLMDDELEAARHLISRGFLRPAGALAGVILERHLKTLLRKHTPPIKYSDKATLAQLNDLCKDTAYDVVTWRKIQHLTDLRNLCDHDKTREPTKDEVTELINGVSAILKTHNI